MGNLGRQRQSRPIFATLLVTACFLFFSGRYASAGEETCTYENSRYDFAVDASCDYFGRFDVIIEADNGDGILLRSEAEGIELRVYGSLVREIDLSVDKIETSVQINPAFVLLGSRSQETELNQSIGVFVAPTARDYVTITVLAESKGASLEELRSEVNSVLSGLRPGNLRPQQ